MVTDIHIENLGELHKQFRDIEGKLTKQGLASALRPGARIFQRAVKRLAPKRTGLLQRSIRTKLGKGRANAPYASMWVTFGKVNTSKMKAKLTAKQQKGKAYYAYMVHNGTVVGANGRRIRSNSPSAKAQGVQRIKPNPFVYDAFEANVQTVADKILNDIMDKL